MQGCTTNTDIMVGRAKTVELAYGCPDQMPEEKDWKLNGLPTSATWDLAPEAIVSGADNGGVSSTMIAGMEPSYSIEGEVRSHDRSDEFGIQQFVKYFADEVMARRQPTVWMRLHWGDYYHIGYMNTTALSDGGGVKDLVTYSLELKLADGATFQIIRDSNVVPVTGVTVNPKTASVKVGATSQLGSAVTPSDATNKAVIWKTSDDKKATVSPNGLVTGVVAGSVTITSTTADSGKTDTAAITVTAA